MTNKTKLRTSPRLSRSPHLSSALRPSRQMQLIDSSEGGTSLPRQLSFAAAVVAGQNAQIMNASTSGLKKKMRTHTTASKKKRREILSSLYKDGEDVDSDGESSGSYRRQSKSKPCTKRRHGGSVVSNRRHHYDSDDDSSASSVPGSRNTSSTKRPASKTKRRSGRHEYR
jgi:hypothetical protein